MTCTNNNGELPKWESHRRRYENVMVVLETNKRDGTAFKASFENR
jgi:hypothetical protein